jgi:molecular chaperone HtpG
MPPEQPAIYYAFGDAREALASSPHLEAVRGRGWEVLYMTDPVDEWATESVREFEGKRLVSVMRAELPLAASDEEKRAREEQATALKPLIEKMRAVLQEQVQEVRLSERLTDSPVCLVVPEGAHHAFVERLLRGHGHKLPPGKRILEVNAGHPLVASLRALFEREPGSPRLIEWIEMLHDQALLTEGSPIADPQRFARRMTTLLEQAAASAS